jgi:cobalamin biosynthesis protein CbiG
MIVAGIGCRPHATAGEILALVRRATAQANCTADALAIPAFRQEAAGPRIAADRLGLPLLLVPRDALQSVQALCPTRSVAAERATGLTSVAEGCALAAAGAGAHLVLPRLASGAVTCALARADAP